MQGRVGGPWESIPLLLLHHTGAKSARAHVNPVAYLPDDSRYFVWAANGGAPNHPAWYHNLKTHPATEIEVGNETVNVVAEEMTGTDRDRLFARATDRYPQLADAAPEDRSRYSHPGSHAHSSNLSFGNPAEPLAVIPITEFVSLPRGTAGSEALRRPVLMVATQ